MEYEMNRIDLLTQKQIDWCNFHIGDNRNSWRVNDAGEIYVESSFVYFRNKDLITNFPVQFSDCDWFKCSGCYNLRSLEGSPKKIGMDFLCVRCSKLSTLKGGPDEVIGNFYCCYCGSLESLEGAPENAGKDFDCSNCNSLKSLDGCSRKIGDSLFFSDCENIENINELKNVFVKNSIFFANSPKIEKYKNILEDKDLIKKWQKSDLCSVDVFLKEYSGFIEGQYYGI